MARVETDPEAVQAKAPLETADLRYLDPKTLRFFRHGATHRLTIADECSVLKVTVARAFPLSHLHQYLSVCDGKNQEVGLIVGLSEVDEESRRLVADALERRCHVPVIRRVLRMTERFGTVDWEVETDRGTCQFTTRGLREKAVQPSPSRYLLTDVDEDRYDVPDLAALDPPSQAWLMRHL